MKKNSYKLYIIMALVLLIIVVAVIFVLQRGTESEMRDRDDKDKENGTSENSSVWQRSADDDDIKDYQYHFDLNLDVENMVMDGVLDFTYYNNNETPMDELVFYLYANSFGKRQYHAIEPEYYDLGYPNGFSPGSIEIKQVDIEGGGSYEVTGSQNHLLIVKLDDAVRADKSTQLKITYKVTVPNSYGRFGYGEQTISIVNCNPIMAVYDAEMGYFDYDYNNVGDPFYSEVGDYSAEITIDEDYLIAPTGTITDKKYKDGMVTYVIDGENRRDFGFVASDEFEVATDEIKGVQVNSYSFSGGRINQKALDAAVNSIDAYSIAFGQYPYETFNVVEANFFVGGMEYPGLVLIDDTYYVSHYEEIMEMIICHEAAHQWWYAQVGNDQIAEPWLDEALATFSERVYYEHVYPQNSKDMIFNYVDKNYRDWNRYLDEETTRIDLHTLEYGDEYALVVYGFGGWMIEDLRQMLGDEVFYEAMQTYLEDNQFQIATREDLEEAIEEVWGEDITPWFDENLQVQVGY